MGKIRIWDCFGDRNRALACAVNELRSGRQIGIPTETVYGLAGSVEVLSGLEGIFFLKRRPLSDPLILHIAEKKWAERYFILNSYQETVFDCLADAFWPGPLTIVAEASDRVPSIIRAGAATVGLRLPAAPFFHETLKTLGNGIAAPSANRFGHISPTRAEHVATEFEGAQLEIFDEGPCTIGLESTVLRIFQDGTLKILRPGQVTPHDLAEALSDAGLEARFSSELSSKHESPGQDIRHYAPDVPTYRAVIEVQTALSPCVWRSEEGEPLDPSGIVFIDFCGSLKTSASSFLDYFDPAPNGDVTQFGRSLFETLRQAEAVAGVRWVVIHFPPAADHKLSAALEDRLERCTSGRRARCHSV